jgi:hypothetical protein
MLAVAEHADAMYWPLAQTPQSEPAVTPWRQYWPAGHATLSYGVAHAKPAGHASCAVERAGQ